MLPAGQVGTAYSQTLTISGATAPATFSISAGSLPAGLSLNASTGVISGTPTSAIRGSFTVVVTDAQACTAIAPLTIVTSSAPVCSLTATATPGVCNTATNTYTVTGTVSATNSPANQSLTVSVGTVSQVVSLSGNGPVSYTLAGLTSDGSLNTVTVMSSATACGMTSVTYTAPASCTVTPGQPKLELEKLVNKSVAQKGDVLTYTIVLRNTGTASATSVTVTDSFSAGISYVANSATAPANTTFTAGVPNSTWQVASLAAGQSLTLTFQVIADVEGILYNTATIPGDTATVCTSVPFKVCAGTDFAFQLIVPAGQSSYQWYRNGTAIGGATSATYVATMIGSYSVSAGGIGSQSACSTGSCCPFIVEELPAIAAFSLTATAPTCVGDVPQTNGTLTVTGLSSVTGLTYELSKGTSFTAGTPVTSGKTALPANGLLSSTLTPGMYWVRVYNAAGCFEDANVEIMAVPCECPEPKCVPFVVKKIVRTTPAAPVGGGGGR